MFGRGGPLAPTSRSTAPHFVGPRKPSRPDENHLLDSKAIRGEEAGNYAVLVTRSCGVTTGVALRALGCPARVCTSGGAHQNRSRGLSLPRYVSHLLSAPKRRSVSLSIICLQTLLSLAPGDQDQIFSPRPTAVVNHIGRLAPSVPPPVIAVRGWTP